MPVDEEARAAIADVGRVVQRILTLVERVPAIEARLVALDAKVDAFQATTKSEFAALRKEMQEGFASLREILGKRSSDAD